MIAFRVVACVRVWVPLVSFLIAPATIGGGGASGGRGYYALTIPQCDPAPGAASRIGVVAASGVAIYEIIRGITAL